MEKLIQIMIVFFAIPIMSMSQVVISPLNNTEEPNTSAIFELKNDDNFVGGVLIPKVNIKSKTDISFLPVPPAEGLLVYNEFKYPDNIFFRTEGYMYWTGTEWKKFVDVSAKYESTTNYYKDDTPAANRTFNAYIGPFIQQDTENGIKVGDFCFKIDWDRNVTNTNVNSYIGVFIKYVGDKAADTLMSYAHTSHNDVYFYDFYGAKVFNPNPITSNNERSGYNTNILNANQWYRWGEPGIDVDKDTEISEKRQYTFTTYNMTEKEFYRCEFVVTGQKPSTNTKLCIYVERIVSNL
ncbi:hypothetical protein LJC11_03290 [Bacteroidales bacterium OttesenSCG-928-I21]|nr:hypothetical protein [Bacteroidales bacterium OttesenSCG-928-I21]